MLNILEYAWIYLNKQSSEYARILNVSDAKHKVIVQIAEQNKYLWKCLNELFWLCKGSEYAWLSYIVTQSSEYVWIWLNIP